MSTDMDTLLHRKSEILARARLNESPVPLMPYGSAPWTYRLNAPHSKGSKDLRDKIGACSSKNSYEQPPAQKPADFKNRTNGRIDEQAFSRSYGGRPTSARGTVTARRRALFFLPLVSLSSSDAALPAAARPVGSFSSAEDVVEHKLPCLLA